ncbi:MAG: FAD-dependent oxidoreductase [Nitrospirae bacterium]|nr:FAD-dependent oxidoreductase [Nitrospirota bacterium]
MHDKTVIVIGAGIAGLTAAHTLAKRGMGVTVLEASDRVGGRMSTDRRDGYVIDRGAQFLTDGYSVIPALLRELGLEGRFRRTSRWSATVRSRRVRRVSGARPWTVVSSGLLGPWDALRLLTRALALRKTISRLPLSDYSEWQALDTHDAADWIAHQFGPDVLEYIFEPMLEGFYFQAPENTSLALPLQVWSYGARRKAIMALEGGMGTLPETLAARLTVHLNTPAQAIESDERQVKVTTPNGSFTADHVVLAARTSSARLLHAPETEVERRLLATSYSSTINLALATGKPVSSAVVAPDIYGLLIPRKERSVIAAVAIESRKCPSYVASGDLLNVMLCGEAGRALVDQPEDRVLAQVLPELDPLFPGIEADLRFTHFCRWPEAEPRSPVGRSRDIRAYRAAARPDLKVVLAGDYMGAPTTEGAAESGTWAANLIAGGDGSPAYS